MVLENWNDGSNGLQVVSSYRYVEEKGDLFNGMKRSRLYQKLPPAKERDVSNLPARVLFNGE